MNAPLADTPTPGLGRFIKEGRFSVPTHQREYSWTEEYVKQFLDDIIHAKERGEQQYFCGLMVFVNHGNPDFLVLDGQQRLATTLILLSAIRNWLRGYSEFRSSETKIQDRYLGDSDLKDDEIQPKLTMNTSNNDVFRRFVIEAVPLDDVKAHLRSLKREDRNRALLEAAIYLNERVSDMAAKKGETAEAKNYLLDLVEYITHKVQIVRLNVQDEDAAFTIFETLNDRGMDLAPLDLVKNYLFSRAARTKVKRNLRDLEDRWTEMMTILSDVKADSFLRAFWASRHGGTEGRRLFAPFKRAYDDADKAYRVSLDLRTAAENYVALFDPQDPIWSKYDDKAKESIVALKIIGASQLYPLILAALDRFDTREMVRLLWLIEVIAVRYQLVERGRPGRMESLGGRTAKAVTDKKITTATKVFEEVRELYIPDADFEARFTSKHERESKKAAYLLAGLERQARQQKQDEHWREIKPDVVTVEHILPKSPGAAWKPALEKYPDFHGEYLHRLGNMCLLSDANRRLGNKSFDEKKETFRTSSLEMTRSVARAPDWNPDEVEKRQKWMAQLAVAYWRFQ
jgi:hypothetical protein